MKKIVINSKTYGRVNVLVDNSDYGLIKNKKWCVGKFPKSKSLYVWRSAGLNNKGNSITQYMHRFLLDSKKGTFVDHKNGNGLDNRRSNLRICTHAQNCHNVGLSTRNTSGYKGVSFAKHAKKWCAQIRKNGKNKKIGYFDSANEASMAWEIESKKIHGEFHRKK